MSAIDCFIPAVLGERARRQPDARAYTFIDYELDPAGDSETLTWFQVHWRAQVVAAELASCGSPGDRVAILAPQGLEYIIGFLGAVEAGSIAVPLSAPQFGAHDERVSAAPGSIPITTSGKVRRSACAERYLQDEFARLDTPA
jgi:long chain fatty acid CoA FadD26